MTTADRPIRLTVAAVAVALAYGSLRALWAYTGAPDLPPTGEDLIVFTGWAPAALCLAAAGLAIGLHVAARSRLLPLLAWSVAGALAVADALFLLDIVGVLIGALTGPVAIASRAACAAVAALLAATAVAHRRRVRDACLRCGRTTAYRRPERMPGWAYAGAWAAVAGCLTRIGAQVVAGFDGIPAFGAALTFEIGFLLAGTLLPLALACRFGRVWPRWVPFLAGRKVPRWLVLGPGAVFSVGLVVYFGVVLSDLAVSAFTGEPVASDPFPAWFFWTAVPAYLLWGTGMGTAAVAYARVTRGGCGACGVEAPTHP